MEEGDWDGWGTDDRLHNVHVESRGCSPDEAVQRLVQRARDKCGAVADLTNWRYWLQEIGPMVTGRTLHFRLDETGRPMPIDQ